MLIIVIIFLYNILYIVKGEIMLQKLKIKNIALIENLDIDFENGLNVITGETGSGKSIIIDSINFLLGARADKSLIRYGEEKAKVEGVFSVDENSSQIVDCFNLLDIEPESTMIISRTMSNQGKSEIKVNGENVSLNILKKIAENLIDIYGQNQQLSIIKPSYQLKLLDDFSQNSIDLINQYKSLKIEINDVNSQIENLGGNDEQRAREIDLLNYQINEIEQAKISQDEETELLETKKRLQNLEKINQYSSDALNNIESAVNGLFLSSGDLQKVLIFDDKLKEISDRVESLCIDINDVNESLKDYVESLGFTNQSVDDIEDRLSLYNDLKRKYGSSVDNILNYYNDIKQRVEKLENCDVELQKLNSEKKKLLSDIFKIGELLSDERKKTAKLLEKGIKENLEKLGMSNAKVEFEFNQYSYDEDCLLSNGLDNVTIMFCANKGEEPKPLKDVASGGEMSRFILAIKSITAQKEQGITMIFDEIDTGISGLMAQAVSEQIARISSKHQVFVITHTIQLASMADCNYLVEKHITNERTISNIKKLNNEERVQEIARFLSTNEINDISIKNAKEIINNQAKLKYEIRKNQ